MSITKLYLSQEEPVSGSCDVMQLLQHGKARQRKSSEQNALNVSVVMLLCKDCKPMTFTPETRCISDQCFSMHLSRPEGGSPDDSFDSPVFVNISKRKTNF